MNAGVPKLGKSNDLKRGQPRDHEIVIDMLADVLGLVGSSPTPGAIFAGLYIIFLFIESKSYLKEVTIC